MSEQPWKLVKLGDYSQVKARIGWRGLSASEYTEEGPFLIAGKHIANGSINWDTVDHISEFRYLESSEIALDEGDVILSKDGTIGRVARIDSLTGKATINGTMMLLRPKADLDYRYLSHVLNGATFKKVIEDKVSGSSIPHIFQRDMVQLELLLPPKMEQQCIARILDSLDTQVRQTEALIAKLKRIKQGLLTDLLTRGIDQNGQLRPTPDQAPHLYKDSPFGQIPKEWRVSDIGSLLSDLEPAMRSGPFGSALLKSELVESGIPLLGIDNVYAEQFRSAYSRFVTRQKFLELSRYAVRPHDVMITIMGTVGRCCLVPEYIGDALSSKHTWTITLDTNKYIPYLAMLQINYAPWALRHLARDEQGGIMSAIRSETLRSLQLPVPPIEEQKLITERLTSISQRIETEGDTAIQLKLVKQGLMDDLLTGRVRVTPLLGDTKPQQAGHLHAESGAHAPKGIMHHDTL